jgi:hypothetical protein
MPLIDFISLIIFITTPLSLSFHYCHISHRAIDTAAIGHFQARLLSPIPLAGRIAFTPPFLQATFSPAFFTQPTDITVLPPGQILLAEISLLTPRYFAADIGQPLTLAIAADSLAIRHFLFFRRYFTPLPSLIIGH